MTLGAIEWIFCRPARCFAALWPDDRPHKRRFIQNQLENRYEKMNASEFQLRLKKLYVGFCSSVFGAKKTYCCREKGAKSKIAARSTGGLPDRLEKKQASVFQIFKTFQKFFQTMEIRHIKHKFFGRGTSGAEEAQQASCGEDDRPYQFFLESFFSKTENRTVEKKVSLGIP